jgi:hypothetical protein
MIYLGFKLEACQVFPSDSISGGFSKVAIDLSDFHGGKRASHRQD